MEIASPPAVVRNDRPDADFAAALSLARLALTERCVRDIIAVGTVLRVSIVYYSFEPRKPELGAHLELGRARLNPCAERPKPLRGSIAGHMALPSQR